MNASDHTLYREARSLTQNTNPDLREDALRRIAGVLSGEELLTLIAHHMAARHIEPVVSEMICVDTSSYEIKLGVGPLAKDSPEFPARVRDRLCDYLTRGGAEPMPVVKETATIEELAGLVHETCGVTLFFDTHEMDLADLLESLLVPQNPDDADAKKERE